jgi:hypothetical protein
MADNELLIIEVSTGLVVTGGTTEAATFVVSNAAGEWGMGANTSGRSAPTHEEIAQLAYSLYELRGREDGHDIEDWQRAEQQLVRHYA